MASEIGRGQTEDRNAFGVRTDKNTVDCSRMVLGKPTKASESLLGETVNGRVCIQSIYRHVESVEKVGGPPSKPKYYSVTDSGAVL